MNPIPSLNRAAFPLVVSGPSGVGKTVLCDMLPGRVSGTVRSISATTRPRRGREVDGVDYFFLTEDRFLADRDSGKMAEWALVHDHYYGTPREWMDRQLQDGLSVVLNIDVQGGLQLRQCYPQSVLVFVLPPDIETLRRRLEVRGTDSDDAISLRLENMKKEIAALPRYDYVVVNDMLEQAGDELAAVVRAERARISRRLPA